MPRNPTSTKPQGRQVTHGLRKLALDYASRELIEGPMADAYRDRLTDIVGDSGGAEHMTGREVALAESAAFASLLTRCMLDEAFRRGSVVNEAGELLPFLGRGYIGWANLLRQNLVALGLKPDRIEKSANLDEYLERNGTQDAHGSARADPAGDPTQDD